MAEHVAFRARMEETDGRLEGFAYVWGDEAKLRHRVERFARDAFDGAFAGDVVLRIGHDRKRLPLASTRSESLDIEVDDDGVRFAATLNLDRADASDAMHAVRDGVVRGASLGMTLDSRDFEIDRAPGRMARAIINRVRNVHEISLVPDPAYPRSSVVARSLEAAEREEKEKAERLGARLEKRMKEPKWRS